MPIGGGFIRIYYCVLDDPKFETIYEDDHHFSTWVRLLMVADQMWPTHPPIPAGARPASLKALIAAGLVDAMPKHCYRIHGLDAEREGRSNQASNAAKVRWQSSRNARASDEQSGTGASYVRAETKAESETETKSAPIAPALFNEDVWDAPETEALQWLAKHQCNVRIGDGFHQTLVTLTERFGVNAVVGMFDRLSSAGLMDGDTKGFVFGAKDALFPKVDLKALEREERADTVQANFDRGVERTLREIARIRGEAS